MNSYNKQTAQCQTVYDFIEWGKRSPGLMIVQLVVPQEDYLGCWLRDVHKIISFTPFLSYFKLRINSTLIWHAARLGLPIILYPE